MSAEKMIPELRFSKFNDSWNQIRLGDAFFNNREKGNDSLPIYSVSQELGLVPRSSLDRSIQKNAKSESNLYVKTGDLVYNMMRMWQGALGIAKNDCMVSPAYIVLRPKKNENSKFYLYLFSRKRSLYLFWAYSYGLTDDRLRLYFKDFAQIKIAVPPYEEQQIIAYYLTAVDKRIQLLQEKKSQLERYKKGVMQKLFSHEIRFKDENGNDFPEWEGKTLGKLGVTFNGLTGKSKEDFGDGKPYVQYMQIFQSSHIHVQDFGLVQITENDNQNTVQYGDVFFTTSSETPNEIGTASVLLKDVGEVYLNSFCFGYRPNSLNELVPEFAQFFFRSEGVRKEIVRLAQGSTRFNMSKIELMKLTFSFPSEREQKKIAFFLSNISSAIEKVDDQIMTTVQFKKGLLQKMFV